MSMKMMARFYTVAEVVELLGVAIRSGTLRAHRFGRQVRISETDLRLFVDEARNP